MISQQLQLASDAFIDFEATSGADDNVARAAKNIDVDNDGFLTLAGIGGYELYQWPCSVLTAKIFSI